MRFSVKNQQGFNLISIMVSLGIASIIMAATASMLLYLLKSNESIKVSANGESLYISMLNTIRNEAMCRYALIDNPFIPTKTPGTAGAFFDVSMDIGFDNSPGPLTAGLKMSDIAIEKMEMQDMGIPPVAVTVDWGDGTGPQAYQRFYTQLSYSYRKLQNLPGGSFAKKQFINTVILAHQTVANGPWLIDGCSYTDTPANGRGRLTIPGAFGSISGPAAQPTLPAVWGGGGFVTDSSSGRYLVLSNFAAAGTGPQVKIAGTAPGRFLVQGMMYNDWSNYGFNNPKVLDFFVQVNGNNVGQVHSSDQTPGGSIVASTRFLPINVVVEASPGDVITLNGNAVVVASGPLAKAWGLTITEL